MSDQRQTDTWPLRLSRGPIAYLGNGYRVGDDARISVEAGLHQLRGNDRPYWSVTGEITTRESRRRRDCDSCGQLHDAILAIWPDLAPVVALHLSDDTGAPMYAVANGIYFAGRSPRFARHGDESAYYDANVEALQRHLRISTEEAEAFLRLPTRAEMEAAIDAMRPRWQAESDAAVAWMIAHGATGARTVGVPARG